MMQLYFETDGIPHVIIVKTVSSIIKQSNNEAVHSLPNMTTDYPRIQVTIKENWIRIFCPIWIIGRSYRDILQN